MKKPKNRIDASHDGEELVKAPKKAIAESQKPDRAESIAELEEAQCQITGVLDSRTANRMIQQMATMHLSGSCGSTPGQRATTASMMLAELKPSNATESLLAIQMFGVHEAALLFLGRATADGQTPAGRDANLHRAARLLHLFTEQIATMQRLKGKAGQQRVVVEHVTVQAGGQAIVGNVSAAKRDQGGGGDAA